MLGIASFATSQVQQGRESSWLVTRDTMETAEDRRAHQIAAGTRVQSPDENARKRVAASGPVGIGYPAYNELYRTVGYPTGEFYGSLLVRPGNYASDHSYWIGTKLWFLFLLFFPVPIWSPCTAVQSVPHTPAMEPLPPVFPVRSGEEVVLPRGRPLPALREGKWTSSSPPSRTSSSGPCRESSSRASGTRWRTGWSERRVSTPSTCPPSWPSSTSGL